MERFKVTIGNPARRRSVIIQADNENHAVTVAVEEIVAQGENRDWLEKYSANRNPRFGTCHVEKLS